MTPAGTSNELDVQNGWEENTHTLIILILVIIVEVKRVAGVFATHNCQLSLHPKASLCFVFLASFFKSYANDLST